jgi:hypothetical protein
MIASLPPAGQYNRLWVELEAGRSATNVADLSNLQLLREDQLSDTGWHRLPASPLLTSQQEGRLSQAISA